MSQVELNINANTSQAEKALMDLSRDVDKLQKKAQAVGKTSNRASSSSSRKEWASAANQGKNQAQANKNGIDSSAIKSAFSGLTSQLGQFSAGISGAINNMSSLTEQMMQLYFAAKSVKAAFTAASAGKAAIDAVKSPSRLRYDADMRTARTFRRNAERQADKVVEAYHAGDWVAYGRANKAMDWYDKAADHRVERAKKGRITSSRLELYGPDRTRLSERDLPMTGRQQLRQGALRLKTNLTSWGPQEGAPIGTHTKQYGPGGFRYGVNTKGIFGGPQSSFPTFRAAGQVASGLVRSAPGAIAAGARTLGAGAMGMLGSVAPALANPYVLGAAAVGSAVAAPYIYGGQQVAQGREKANELTNLETQFGQLSKNLTGAEVDVLSEKLQKLGIQGVVPVEQLSKSASMLMLSFKGNQKETSKWTEIIADMSAGTGQSAEYFAELITKANQFGTVEFEVFNQLNEKGIPIIEQLKGKFGDTREEIMKAAQDGKITAQEFMKAFEAAHKVSMEGANARKALATREDIQRQTQDYDDLLAANATRAYDEVLKGYDEERLDRAEARASDEYLIATQQALGDTTADLVEIFRWATDKIGDGITWLSEALFAWNIDEEVNKTMDKMIENANKAYRAAGDKSTKSQALETYAASLEKDIQRLNSIANNDEFDDEERERALGDKKYIEGILKKVEQAAEARAKEERIAAAKEKARREEVARKADMKAASEAYKKYQSKNGTTEEELLKSREFGSYDALERTIGVLRRHLEAGTGTTKDLKALEEYEDLKEAIDKLRDEIAREAKQKETERKNAEEKAKREQERLEREARQAAKEERARDNYVHDLNARLNPEDAKLTVKKDFELIGDKLKGLGFSTEEATQLIDGERKVRLAKVKKEREEKRQQLKEEEMNYKGSKMMGKGMETNAWGSTGNLYTQFTQPYDKKQYDELVKANKYLDQEVKVLQKLKPGTYAQ